MLHYTDGALPDDVAACVRVQHIQIHPNSSRFSAFRSTCSVMKSSVRRLEELKKSSQDAGFSDKEIQDDWYRFRDESIKDIAIDFLESEGIAFVDDVAGQAN